MDSPGRTPGRTPKISWSLRDTLRSLDGGPGYTGPPSDHFDGQVFFNPERRTRRSFGEFLKWQRTREPKPWPRWVVNRARPHPPASLAPGEIALTFINHITFLVQFAGLNILTDPVYSKRVSPFRSVGPQRVREPGLAFDALPPIHLVLVTHNHYDHLDLPTLLRLEAVHAPHFITGLGNRAFLQQFGLRTVEELDWWQATSASGQATSASGQTASASGGQVIMTPAQHWSSRRPRNRNRTLWGGFVVQCAGRQLYFAGDTGYGGHFRQVRERLGHIDLALLPIGAYEPRWFMRDQHMNPDDAVLAHRDLEAATSVGTHFGCFQLTDEGIDEPVADLAVARQKYGVADEAFQVLDTGETRLLRW